MVFTLHFFSIGFFKFIKQYEIVKEVFFKEHDYKEPIVPMQTPASVPNPLGLEVTGKHI